MHQTPDRFCGPSFYPQMQISLILAAERLNGNVSSTASAEPSGQAAIAPLPAATNIQP